MSKLKSLNCFEEKNIESEVYDNINLFIERNVRGNIIHLRPIEEEDTEMAISIAEDEELCVFTEIFLLARCIRQINSYDRYKWSWFDWMYFIYTINIKNKLDYMQELRKLSYQPQKDFSFYF